jgi:hypothetical protein
MNSATTDSSSPRLTAASRTSRLRRRGGDFAPPGKRGGKSGNETVKTAIDVHRQSEAMVGLQRNEAMECGAQCANRVDGIVIAQLVSGHDVGNHPDNVATGDLFLDIPRRRRSLRRRVSTGVLDRPSTVRVGHGGNRPSTGTTDGCSLQDIGELILGPQRDAASEPIGTGDVLVERRLPDAESSCQGRKRQSRQANLISNPLALLNDERLGEPRPRHGRRGRAETGARRRL